MYRGVALQYCEARVQERRCRRWTDSAQSSPANAAPRRSASGSRRRRSPGSSSTRRFLQRPEHLVRRPLPAQSTTGGDDHAVRRVRVLRRRACIIAGAHLAVREVTSGCRKADSSSENVNGLPAFMAVSSAIESTPKLSALAGPSPAACMAAICCAPHRRRKLPRVRSRGSSLRRASPSRDGATSRDSPELARLLLRGHRST